MSKPKYLGSKKFERIVFLPDIHSGADDKDAISLALNCVKYLKPDRIIQLGDFMDFYSLSSYPTNPELPIARLTAELNRAHAILDAFSEAAPKARKQMIKGNHEDRLDKWLHSKAQALIGWKELEIPRMLELYKRGWEPRLYDSIPLCRGIFNATHGSIIRSDAGASAKAEMLRFMSSGISGHTHRAAQFFHRSQTGLMTWVECGHLSLNPPNWKTQVQNWQQAIAFGEFEYEGSSFELHLIPFTLNYHARIEGKEITR